MLARIGPCWGVTPEGDGCSQLDARYTARRPNQQLNLLARTLRQRRRRTAAHPPNLLGAPYWSGYVAKVIDIQRQGRR
jgi:hypothetical protein